MNDRPRMMTIRLMKAHCHVFPGRKFCWSAMHPYYGGHYPTKREAMAAARKSRERQARKWGART